MAKQAFKEELYKGFSERGAIFLTGAREALGVPEFIHWLITEQGVTLDEMQTVLKGCSKCWRELGQKLGPEKSRQINAKIQELDKEGKLRRGKNGQVFSREFKDKKKAQEFLENLSEKEFTGFFVGYRI